MSGFYLTTFFVGVLAALAGFLLRGFLERKRKGANHAEIQDHSVANERFKLLAKATNESVWDWNLKTDLLWWNENYFSEFGYPNTQELYPIASWSDAIHPDDRSRVIKKIYHAIETRQHYWSDEYRFLKSDGTVVFIFDRAYMVYDEAGVPERLVGTMLNVTERKTAEMAVSREKDLSDLIINSLPGAFYCYDRAGAFFRWNKNFEIAAGCSAEEISKMHPLQFLGDEYLSRAKIESVFQNGTDELETDFVRKDGHRTPYYFNGSRIVIDDIEYLMGLGIDISRRKLAEEKILAVYREKEMTLNRIDDAVVAVDTEWRYTFLNDASLAQHPNGREGTLGKHMLEIHPDMEFTVFWTTYQEAMRTMTVQEVENYYAPLDVWFSVKVYPSQDGLTIFYNNITERKKTEQEMLTLIDSLQAKNSDLQQFSYIVSHNLRSPIAKIIGLADLTSDDKEENRMILGVIEKEAKHLDEVVTDISTIVYAHKSNADQKKLVSLEAQLNGVRQALSTEIFESKAAIVADFSRIEELVTIKSFLYSILYNLISNSIKYRRPDVPLQIKVQSEIDDKFVCISVQDNGRGIDLKLNEDKMFRLYRRFHDATIPGRGVGLNLIKTHAESLGGHVEVESEVDKGSTFRIYILK
jgi:PAS domain S-box-containing protein